MTKPARHRLHHDLLGMEDAIDHDTEGLAADLRDDDEAALGVGVAGLFDPEQALEMNERQQLIAQPQHWSVLDALDAMFGLAAHAHQLEYGELRNGETITAGFDDEGRDDGKCQRDLDGERAATPTHRFHVDDAADLVDIGAHDVHADAAARHAGDLVDRRETGRKDE